MSVVQKLQEQPHPQEYNGRFKCEAGLIALWDNRAGQHPAASDGYPHPRALRRVTVSREKPFFKKIQDLTYRG